MQQWMLSSITDALKRHNKTAAAFQKCHKCTPVEEKASINTSCFSSVTGTEKEAEVKRCERKITLALSRQARKSPKEGL